MNLQLLLQALHASWNAATSSTPSEWSPDNPARGQCVISSLVVQDYLGGDLVRFHVTRAAGDERHYANLLENSSILDTTASQYTGAEKLERLPINLKGYPTVRAKRLADPGTSTRYKLLKDRVERYLSEHGAEFTTRTV